MSGLGAMSPSSASPLWDVGAAEKREAPAPVKANDLESGEETLQIC